MKSKDRPILFILSLSINADDDGYADGTELFLKFLTLFVVIFNSTFACPVKLQFHCYSKQRDGTRAAPISKRNLIHGSLWLSEFQRRFEKNAEKWEEYITLACK